MGGLMGTYRRTQIGTLIIAVMFGTAAVFIIVGWLALRPLLFTVPLLVIAGLLFYSLTIEVADGELRWHFGPGLIRKSARLADIASVEVARTSFIEGWGIHYSRFGWLYNVSGFDAVAVTLKNGKRFALGTDDAPALANCLNAARQ